MDARLARSAAVDLGSTVPRTSEPPLERYPTATDDAHCVYTKAVESIGDPHVIRTTDPMFHVKHRCPEHTAYGHRSGESTPRRSHRGRTGAPPSCAAHATAGVGLHSELDCQRVMRLPTDPGRTADAMRRTDVPTVTVIHHDPACTRESVVGERDQPPRTCTGLDLLTRPVRRRNSSPCQPPRPDTQRAGWTVSRETARSGVTTWARLRARSRGPRG
jgi:hypothetical protein